MVDNSESTNRENTSAGLQIGKIVGGIQNAVLAGRDAFVNLFGADASAAIQAQRNRQAMLSLVESIWITGLLDHSLAGRSFIALELEERGELIEQAWPELRDAVGRPSVTPTAQTTTAFFDAAMGALLILGEPGSGKTTQLLILARELIARARQDPTHPIPVVLNLASWTGDAPALADWIVAELNTRYYIPRQVAEAWLRQDELLLLLDGLDEVHPDQRRTCVRAINDFRLTRGLTKLTICCRRSDYEVLYAAGSRFRLQNAIYLKPLTKSQIDSYLQGVGIAPGALSDALSDDPPLWELARSPLMLNIMVQTYQGRQVSNLHGLKTIERRRRVLLNIYVDTMFKRRGLDSTYSARQTKHLLRWLARHLQASDQSTFLIENIQPDWLNSSWQRAFYLGSFRLIGGLAFLPLGVLSFVLANRLSLSSPFDDWQAVTLGLFIWLAFGLAFFLASAISSKLPAGLAVGLGVLGSSLFTWPTIRILNSGENITLVVLLVASIIFGLPGAVVGGWFAGTDRIKVLDLLHWDWPRAILGLLLGLLVSGMINIVWMSSSPLLLRTVLTALPHYLAVSFLFGLLFMITFGLRRSRIVTKTMVPNQGIRQSATHALFIGLIAFLACFVGGVASLSLSGDQHALQLGLAFALIFGPLFGGAAMLAYGGVTCIQHFLLRAMLYWLESLPLQLVPFLDYLADRILLRKVGGGYIFIHRLLLDHFTEVRQ